jgi:hypothetical protein
LGKKKKRETVSSKPVFVDPIASNDDRINELIELLEERSKENREQSGRVSTTGRCHCGGYLWWHESLGYYKCGDCLCRYDKTLVDPDLAEVPDSEKP